MIENYIVVNATLPPLSFEMVSVLFMLVVILFIVLIWLELSACLEILTEILKKQKGNE